MPPSPNAPDTKNLALAIALSLAILFGFQYFYEAPRERVRLAQVAATQAAQAKQDRSANPAATSATTATVPAGQNIDRPQALALTQRIGVDGPGVDGTISTLGARFDDLKLKRYKETIKPDSKEITLLHPQGTADGYYAFYGYTAPDGVVGALPGPNTVWTAPVGAKLTPASPVTLTYDNGQGLLFARTVSMSDDYLFTVTDKITNTSAAPVTNGSKAR